MAKNRSKMKTKMIKTIEKIKETYAKKTITAVLLIALLLSVGIVSASADQIGDKRTVDLDPVDWKMFQIIQ